MINSQRNWAADTDRCHSEKFRVIPPSVVEKMPSPSSRKVQLLLIVPLEFSPE